MLAAVAAQALRRLTVYFSPIPTIVFFLRAALALLSVGGAILFCPKAWRIALLSPPSASLGHQVPSKDLEQNRLPAHAQVQISLQWALRHFILIPATTRQTWAFSLKPPFKRCPSRNPDQGPAPNGLWNATCYTRLRSIRLEIRGDKRREPAPEAEMRRVRSWSCWSCVGLLFLGFLGETTASHVGRPKRHHDSLHWIAKAQVTAQPLLRRDDEGLCPGTAPVLCPASLSGGCCASGYECAIDSCYATTAGPTTACGKEGFFACGAGDSGKQHYNQVTMLTMSND